MDISDDKKTAHISIKADLDTAALETLIAALAGLRAQMEPAVEHLPPSAADTERRSVVSVQSDPDIVTAALTGGRVRFWLRHTGLGWIAVQLSADKARIVRDYLIKWVPGEAPVNLIGDDNRGGETLQ